MTAHDDTASPREGATGEGATAGGTTTASAEGSRPSEQEQDGAQGAAAAAAPETVLWTGPTAWIVPGLVAALGLVGVWGGLTLETPPNAARPGPGAFPLAIGVLLLIAAACMAVVNVRNRGRAGSGPAWFEARPVLLVLAGVAVHTALLEILGWLIAGALLFWVVAYAFGARAYLRDAVVALSMSAAVQVGFSLGLGLALPGGFLGTVL
ncbi:tripartite tricarboxylate transporter TctB family protein [Nocardiopsis xinjiangensis]|uniref:tripartite tricarboxylate transporter TctB family protein n=1 Tax=Nocardiopsis xinjiangensis TaxID=124285 RepID=UPI00034542AD|nr:tripartite tricarboxylate transporter TctB family protein [Nocardiopsis xinjiangensis]